MVFLEVKMQREFRFHPNNLCEGLHKAVILRLIGAPRKSSNEHRFFVAVTSLSKIGEGRIRDLTGDVLFPVTFRCAILTVTQEGSKTLLVHHVQ